MIKKITASRIKEFSARISMNEFLINNYLTLIYDK